MKTLQEKLHDLLLYSCIEVLHSIQDISTILLFLSDEINKLCCHNGIATVYILVLLIPLHDDNGLHISLVFDCLEDIHFCIADPN